MSAPLALEWKVAAAVDVHMDLVRQLYIVSSWVYVCFPAEATEVALVCAHCTGDGRAFVDVLAMRAMEVEMEVAQR